ncbi:MAG TPA: Hpt domain-containing protein, partial [Candidatus Nitrosotenuis sp.]|nr:Hpt domain-containing protein [Candidatus Nitrosotenuis sp.]
MPVDSKLQSNLANLQRAYVENLTKHITQIDHLTAQQQRGNFNLESLQELKFIAHKLAGSGKTFGFPDISDYARQLEQFIFQAESESSPFSLFIYQQLLQGISDL